MNPIFTHKEQVFSFCVDISFRLITVHISVQSQVSRRVVKLSVISSVVQQDQDVIFIALHTQAFEPSSALFTLAVSATRAGERAKRREEGK